MKKVLFTIALVAFGFAANAQFVVGGNFDIQHSGDHDKDYTAAYGSQSATNITIMPKIGYQLNDKMQAGVSLGVEYGYTRNYGGADNTYTSDPTSTFRFDPYFRYNVATWKSFTVFCEAQLNIGIHPESKSYGFYKGDEVTGSPFKNGDNWTSFGINVIPGLNYAITSNISMDIYVNLIGLYANMTSYENHKDHAWGLYALAGDQSLNAHLNNFSIGFNYHF